MNSLLDRVEALEGAMDELKSRRLAVERQLWMWRGIAFGLAVLGLVLITSDSVRAGAGAKGSTVKAPFTVVDAQGKPMLQVKSWHGANYLALLNKAGHEPVILSSAMNGGGSLAISDKVNNPVVDLYAGPKGGELSISRPIRKGAVTGVVHLGAGQFSANSQVVGGVLTITDMALKGGAELRAGPNGGEFDIRDTSGSVVFHKP
jgi:hypothetical protein